MLIADRNFVGVPFGFGAPAEWHSSSKNFGGADQLPWVLGANEREFSLAFCLQNFDLGPGRSRKRHFDKSK